MKLRSYGLAIAASLAFAAALCLAVAHAQAETNDRVLRYFLGRWASPETGAIIEFYRNSGRFKFRYEAGPGIEFGGIYRSGEGNVDLVLTYAKGVKCYYEVRFGATAREIIFALRNVEPSAERSLCVEGVTRKVLDTVNEADALPGRWASASGAVIEFYSSDGASKFRYEAGPDSKAEGAWSPGEDDVDLMLTYSDGLKCSYSIRDVSGFSSRDVVDNAPLDFIFALSSAKPGSNARACVKGLWRKQP